MNFEQFCRLASFRFCLYKMGDQNENTGGDQNKNIKKNEVNFEYKELPEAVKPGEHIEIIM